MKIESTTINGLLIIEPKVFGDSRGAFFESYNEKAFIEAVGEPVHFVQDNQSTSTKGVLRGLHFQNPPNAQGKLVRVVQGSVLDVALDIRKGSSTYGHHFSIELSAENNRQLWIPPGFAHGFSVLSEEAVFMYRCTAYYSKEDERSILFNDPDLKINWKVDNPLVSAKDLQAKRFKDIDRDFIF